MFRVRRRPGAWRISLPVAVVGLTVAFGICFPATAGAATKQLWYVDHINQVASDVAGFPVEADMEDNWDQWTWEVFAGTNGNPPPDASAVLGFTFPFATPDGYMWWRASDGVTHSILIYHHVFLSPTVYGELMRIEQQGIVSAASADLLGTAEGLLALVHEATHQKLDSGDESRVNACAVQEIPDVLTNDYGLPATVSTTSSVPQHYRVLVRRRVRVHGRWVVRKRYVTRTRYVDVTTTGPNPVFTEIVGEVAKYRSNQPAPYNTGTCW